MTFAGRSRFASVYLSFHPIEAIFLIPVFQLMLNFGPNGVSPLTKLATRLMTRGGPEIRREAEEDQMTVTPEQVKAGRRLIGWSRDDLGGHSGVSATTIGNFEAGKNRRLSLTWSWSDKCSKTPASSSRTMAGRG
jgi:DNA-binding XRE family transcriptional regulator